MHKQGIALALALMVALAGGLGFGLVTAAGLDDPNAAGNASGAVSGDTPPKPPDVDVPFEPNPNYPLTQEGASTDSATISSSGTFEVHILDVGQADAAVIFSPDGETMVIDTGNWYHNGQVVIDFLEAHNVDTVDHLVATHAHADHIGGHADVIEHFETNGNGIGAAYDSGVPTTSNVYDDYLDAVATHNVTLYEIEEGDEIQFAGVDVTVFNPPEGDSGDDLHYNSVTILLEYGDTSFLFTGDAEEDAETRMANEYGDDLEATILHAGHHGSSTSSHHVFLDEVEPEATAISSAYDSQFGHPHDVTLDRFAAHGVCAYWTGTHGTTSFVSDGSEFTVYAQVDATTDPQEIKDEDEAGLDPLAPTTEVGTVTPNACDGTTNPATLDADPATPSTTSEHTWTLTDAAADFHGEADEITVEYPTGTSLDGLDQDDVTVYLDRDGDGTLDEIRVNNDQYAGSEATFDLDGRYNTNVAGELVVVIDGVENPSEGDYTATITIDGDDTYVEPTDFVVE